VSVFVLWLLALLVQKSTNTYIRSGGAAGVSVFVLFCTSKASNLSTCCEEGVGRSSDGAGAQFTGFTSTNVQILTRLAAPAARRGSAVAVMARVCWGDASALSSMPLLSISALASEASLWPVVDPGGVDKEAEEEEEEEEEALVASFARPKSDSSTCSLRPHALAA
jgi:hypothetical protein